MSNLRSGCGWSFGEGIYGTLFFFLGLIWFVPVPSIAFWERLLTFLLVSFYTLNNVFFRRRKFLGFYSAFFLLCFFIFFAHWMLTNLWEAVRFGYVPTVLQPHIFSEDKYMTLYANQIYDKMGLGLIFRSLWHIARLYVIFQCLREDADKGVFLRAFAWGNIFFVVFLSVFLSQSLSFYESRLILELQPDVLLHPNRVAILFLFGFYVHGASYRYARLKVSRLFHLFFCGIAVAVIFFSGARSALLGLLLGMGVLFVSSMRGPQLCVALLFVFLMAIWGAWSGADFFLLLPERLTWEGVSADRGSGRLDVWKGYFQYAELKHYLLGVGPSATPSVIFHSKPVFAEFIAHPSSTYLYFLFTYGLGGLLAYCLFWLFALRKIFKDVNQKLTQGIFLSMMLTYLAWGLTSYLSPLNDVPSMFVAVLLAQVFKHPPAVVSETKACTALSEQAEA